MAKSVLVHQNLEADFPAWICTHAEPQTPKNEGEVTLCALCSDALADGEKAIDEETGKVVLDGTTRPRRPVT
jgi:hypothetical protein